MFSWLRGKDKVKVVVPSKPYDVSLDNILHT